MSGKVLSLKPVTADRPVLQLPSRLSPDVDGLLLNHQFKPVHILVRHLWTGQLPDHIRDRLIAHLTDPTAFWGDYIIPTVACNHPDFDSERMWRGPVWANINYFFVEALDQIDEHDLARTLREKTLDLVMAQPSIYEYYSADTGKPPATAADIFGWTAAVFIDLAIQASRERGVDIPEGSS